MPSDFTPACENAAEPPIPTTEVTSSDTFVSLPFVWSDTERPLEIGDRVNYVGGYERTMHACGHEPMLVAGFCRLGTGAIACRTVGGKIVWIYPESLERV